jgi:putative Mn2+ efflux pump MntP
MAGLFGLFQAVMPVLGWLGGTRVLQFIQGWDHWVAFGLLAFIGGKMILDAARGGEACQVIDVASWRTLLLLAVATSIDALAVGLTFAMVRQAILLPALLIGVITFATSLIGVYLGQRFGDLIHHRAQLLGGLVLLFIGARILFTDLGGPAFLRAMIA